MDGRGRGSRDRRADSADTEEVSVEAVSDRSEQEPVARKRSHDAPKSFGKMLLRPETWGYGLYNFVSSSVDVIAVRVVFVMFFSLDIGIAVMMLVAGLMLNFKLPALIFVTARLIGAILGIRGTCIRDVRTTRSSLVLFMMNTVMMTFAIYAMLSVECRCSSWNQCEVLNGFRYFSKNKMFNQFPEKDLFPAQPKLPFASDEMPKPTYAYGFSAFNIDKGIAMRRQGNIGIGDPPALVSETSLLQLGDSVILDFQSGRSRKTTSEDVECSSSLLEEPSFADVLKRETDEPLPIYNSTDTVSFAEMTAGGSVTSFAQVREHAIDSGVNETKSTRNYRAGNSSADIPDYTYFYVRNPNSHDSKQNMADGKRLWLQEFKQKNADCFASSEDSSLTPEFLDNVVKYCGTGEDAEKWEHCPKDFTQSILRYCFSMYDCQIVSVIKQSAPTKHVTHAGQAAPMINHLCFWHFRPVGIEEVAKRAEYARDLSEWGLHGPGVQAAWMGIVEVNQVLSRDLRAVMRRKATMELNRLMVPKEKRELKGLPLSPTLSKIVNKMGCKCDRSQPAWYGGRCTRSSVAVKAAGAADDSWKHWCFIDPSSHCDGSVTIHTSAQGDWSYNICEEAGCKCRLGKSASTCQNGSETSKKFVDAYGGVTSVYQPFCTLPFDHTCPIYEVDGDPMAFDEGAHPSRSFWPCNRFQMLNNKVETETTRMCNTFHAIYTMVLIAFFVASLPVMVAMTKFLQRRCIDTGPLARQFSGERGDDSDNPWEDLSSDDDKLSAG